MSDDNTKFKQTYRCYPPSFLEKSHLENGDKVLMPPSALDRLAYSEIEFPMLFELNNPSSGRVSHCGVLEFSADEGMIYIPYWMMENMNLQEGDIVLVKNISLLKGKYVKLQPHTMDFLDISNPKAVLETTLRTFSCLTTGDTIMVAYNNKKFYIDIVETKPSPAVSIIETDCEVDFAPPLDYREPEKPTPSILSKRKIRTAEELLVPEERAEKLPRFGPFTGSAKRLDGKQSTESKAPVSSPPVKHHEAKATNGPNDSRTSHRRNGKLVFGSEKDQAPTNTSKVPPENGAQQPVEKAEKPVFQAFTGKKYSLKG